MSKDEGNPNDEARPKQTSLPVFFVIRASTLIRHSSFGFRRFSVRAQATCFDVVAAAQATIHSLDAAGFGAGNCAGGFAVADFAGANGFTKASLKS